MQFDGSPQGAKKIDRTRDEIEQERLEAHHEAMAHANFPTTLTINQVDIPLAKYKELEQLSDKRIKDKALNLKDSVNQTGSRFFEHHKHLARVPHQSDMCMAWIIDVQVILSNALGWEFDASDFGAPAADMTAQPAFEQRAVSKPCWAQTETENVSNAAPPSRYNANPCWSQGEQQATKAYKQPVPMANESRFDDAARIRARNNSAGFTLG